MQTSSIARQRKHSDVAEEDETAAGSGSESSRRSQRYHYICLINDLIFNYIYFLDHRVTH